MNLVKSVLVLKGMMELGFFQGIITSIDLAFLAGIALYLYLILCNAGFGLLIISGFWVAMAATNLSVGEPFPTCAVFRLTL